MGAEVTNGGTLRYRMDRAEADIREVETSVEKLSGRIDRLVMALVSATIGFAVAAVLLALNLTTGTAP